MSRSWPTTFALVSCSLAAAACAPRFRAEMVAQSSLSVRPEAPAAPLTAELPIADPAAVHVLAYQIVVPRALELKWKITCPGQEREGTVGETFEAYKQRRLAELERERRSQAAAVGSLVGAVVPGAEVEAQATTPDGSASGNVQAGVDPGAAAEGAVLASTPAPELPAGDVGAQILHGKIELYATAPGACTYAIWSDRAEQDPSGVKVNLTLEKMVDVREEAAAKRRAQRAIHEEAARGVRVEVVAGLTGRGARPRTRAEQHQAAVDVRVKVIVGLTARGADPGKRARERAQAEEARRQRAEEAWARGEAKRRREAEARWKREEEKRMRWEAEAELHRRGLLVRGEVWGRLIGLGADPTLRARQEEERIRAWEEERRRLEEERAAAEEALRLEAEAALEIRASVKLQLHARGAVDRPSRPAPLAETPPAPPFAGAVWIGGSYEWDGAAWVWVAGHYERPPQAGVVWIGPVEVSVGGTVVVKPGRWVKVRDHK